MAAGRSAARAATAPLRAGRTLIPCRFSLVVRAWLATGCPGTLPGKQAAGSPPVVGDHQPFLRLGGQTLQEAGEAGR